MSNGVLIPALPGVLGRVAEAKHVLALFDFDGTLAPIVADRHSAAIPPSVRDAIVEIGGHPRATVGIVSGRALEDLMERTGLGGIIYAGNNGNEICGQGLRFVEPAAIKAQPELRALLAKLAGCLRHLRAATIEDKGLTATVHIRGASSQERYETVQILRSLLRDFTMFVAKMGVYALDIMPDNGWHKGAAIEWIRRELGLHDALVIYAGDDAPDEDVFASVPGHVTIRVGGGVTRAAYSVDSPSDVWDLLLRLPGVLDSASQ